jgi:hypothetical protein
MAESKLTPSPFHIFILLLRELDMHKSRIYNAHCFLQAFNYKQAKIRTDTESN